MCFRCSHGNSFRTHQQALFLCPSTLSSGCGALLILLYTLRLFHTLKYVDISINSRLQTDLHLYRGDNNVTDGSFHLGCCAGVSCGPPLHVANGVVRGAVFQFGDVALYSCFGGYTMEGIGRSRCLENGTWTPPPTCRGRESMTDSREPLSLSPPLSVLPASSAQLICSSLDSSCSSTNTKLLLLDCTEKLLPQQFLLTNNVVCVVRQDLFLLLTNLFCFALDTFL